MTLVPLHWVLLLAALAAAGWGVERLRVRVTALGYVCAAICVGILQRAFVGSVTLDDCVFAPVLLALPVVAGVRGGARQGASCGATQWIVLAALSLSAGRVGNGTSGEDGFTLAVVLGALSGGLAPLLPHARVTGPLAALIGWGAFLFRDDRFWRVPSMWAGPLLAVAWSGLLLYALERRALSAA